jgi:putative ABC transport system substrate-binding protein
MTPKRWLLVIALVVATGWWSAPAAEEPPPVVTMILWRGWTKAEEGFKDRVRETHPGARLLVYDAQKELARLGKIFADIERQGTDLIYSFGTTVTKAAIERFPARPVVYNAVNRPVESGIIREWHSSGNNATGASNQVPIANQLRTLKKVVDLRRLGLVYNPLEENARIQREIVKGLGGQLRFEVVDFPFAADKDPARMMKEAAGRVDAIYFPADSMVKSHGRELVAAAHRVRLPTLAAIDDMVREDGALLGLVPDYYEMGRLAGEKAIRILSGGRPGEVPSSTLEAFQVLVNLKAARAIGVQVPLSLLMISDQIVRR